MIQYLSLVAWITVVTLLMSVAGPVADQTQRQGSIGTLVLKHGSGEGVSVYFNPDAGEGSARELLAPGTRVHVVGKWTSEDEPWLLASREDEEVPLVLPRYFWVPEDTVRLPADVLETLPFVLDWGLWLVDVSSTSEPVQLTRRARWNSWQWDHKVANLWYADDQTSTGVRDYGRLTQLRLSNGEVRTRQGPVSGDVLAAPSGGAVLVRQRDWDTWPLGKVFILDEDGDLHQIGTQCWVTFSDAYHSFGEKAAWSPDGRYVVLRESPSVVNGAQCWTGQIGIYSRSGRVERDQGNPNSPYRQGWFVEPHFADQVGMDEVCEDRPPGVAKSNGRNRCQWSPDRQWFATMPGAADNPHLGELLIYAADGQLVRRFLVPGWPCNMFQWSPDSQWLAYGGPSGCA